MLFDSSLRKDLGRNFAATLVVVLTIVLTMFLIRTLGQAALGIVSPQDVALVLGYISLGHLPTMLAMSMFVSVVTTLGRMYRDSEMVVWFASGVGLTRFVRPVLRSAWPVLLVVAVLALFVWPWVNLQQVELRERFERRSDLARVAPGQFQASGDGSRVFFIERDEGDRSGRNVFILARSAVAESVTSAGTGTIERVGDDRWLVLGAGQRNEQRRDTGESTLARFERYRVLVGESAAARADALPANAVRTIDHLRQPTPRGQGELAWRLGLALGAVNLVLLGIALSRTQPRRASNWNLLFALLAFAVYYNLINLTQAWVAAGTVSLGSALLSVHGTAFALAVGLIAGRERLSLALGRRLTWPRLQRAAAAPTAGGPP
jgi:lipopolysaccharide export system permease protein